MTEERERAVGWELYICSCTGCWACKGRIMGCTCDVDWDAIYEERLGL